MRIKPFATGFTAFGSTFVLVVGGGFGVKVARLSGADSVAFIESVQQCRDEADYLETLLHFVKV